MMKKILFLLTLISVLSGCVNTTNKKATTSHRPTTDSTFISGELWDIKAWYPVYGNDFIDATVSRFIQKNIDDFKSSVGDEVVFEDLKNELQINFEVFNTTHNIISIVFKEYMFAGGAHGNSFYESLIINTSTNEIQKLSDFFNGSALNNIQEPVREFLKKELTTTEFIEEGTQTLADFNIFSLTDSDITFWFSPYQVAAYSEGPRKVSLPLTSLPNFNWPH